MKYVNFSTKFRVKMTNIPPPPYETVPLGVDHFAYKQLTVGILRDEELEFVTIEKLWLPLEPRINEFRWALKSTFLGKPSWRVNLNRWCPFWFSFNTHELWDPNSKKPLRVLHTDETLSDLLTEHIKAPRRVFFFLEELKTQRQWKPKVSYKVHSTLETTNTNHHTNSDKQADEEKMLMTMANWDSNFETKCQSVSYAIIPFTCPVLVPIFLPVYTLPGMNSGVLDTIRYGTSSGSS
ncbi:hypothetical protein GpartN1_g3075.t1 [Galdieria partita]|uniref:Uncharacterized protein n=1 Tax=Galdieria partita TaxID=83374 RepID=A0A9C7PW44_9RHOD|nr:hypothetical protein GpartN1_g3075.t1 [Galdieria partita]